MEGAPSSGELRGSGRPKLLIARESERLGEILEVLGSPDTSAPASAGTTTAERLKFWLNQARGGAFDARGGRPQGRRSSGSMRPRSLPPSVHAPHPAREHAAHRPRGRRRGGARWQPTEEPDTRSRSPRLACCFRTSPACRRSSTSPRCETPCATSAAIRRGSTRSSGWNRDRPLGSGRRIRTGTTDQYIAAHGLRAFPTPR